MARNEDMLNQVLTHVRSGCQELMQFEPRIFPISAEKAFRAKQTSDSAEKAQLWTESRFEVFENFITEQLTNQERLSLKLNAPLDAAGRLMHGLDERMEDRRKILKLDEQNLSELDQRLEEAKKSLIDGYGKHVTEVDNLLLQMERRGLQFLDDTIRISKLNMIRDRDLFKEEFIRQVVRDTDKQVEDQVTEAVDGLLKQALNLWNQTVNEFAERVRAISGQNTTQRGDFFYNRTEVFNTIMKEATRKIEMYSLKEEARRILENARNAAAFFMGTEAMAVGIGAIATIVVTATAMDVTGGFIAAGVLAVVGLIFLPRQKRKAIQEFKERVAALRADMRKALIQQLNEEVDQSLTRVSDTVKPYVDFVKTERQMVDQVSQNQVALNEQLEKLREQISKEIGTGSIVNNQ